MNTPCLSCNTTTHLEVTFEVKSFVCPSCKTMYVSENGDFKYNRKFRDTVNATNFIIGQKAIFYNEEYIITGILLKKAYDDFYWREFILEGTNDNYLYLSEADGHWMVLDKIENELVTDVKFEKNVKEHNDIVYDLYARYSVEIVSAIGYFDFIISKTAIGSLDFINPPNLISIENSHNLTESFYGTHISKSEIKKAFNVKDLPSKIGVGLVQPFFINLKNLALIFCSFAILILISHYFLNRNQKEKQVLYATIELDENSSKELISPSFELVGSSAPLTISVFSDVSNSWANAQIGLINEKTREENFVSKDVEYYSGYTDGESWSEGGTSEEFNFCGVGAGKYHLLVIPSKDTNNTSNKRMEIKAVWSKPSMRNVFFIFLFMGLFWTALYFIKREFEKRRWKDSDYSPYFYDEQ